jgi:hypothetical protein
VYQREECIAQADACREKAQADLEQYNRWIDEAVVWLQRAIETRHENAITREAHDGRLIPMPAK